MIVIVDNTRGSQNTYYKMLVAYLKTRRLAHMSVRTVAEMRDVLKSKTATCFILSGSSTDIPDMDETHARINEMAIKSGAPVIGICFGAQFICTYFGGSIEKMSRFLCASRKVHNTTDASADFQARFCAKYRISKIPPKFVTLATSVIEGNTTVVAFKTQNDKITALLFHPEFDSQTYYILDGLIARYTHK